MSDPSSALGVNGIGPSPLLSAGWARETWGWGIKQGFNPRLLGHFSSPIWVHKEKWEPLVPAPSLRLSRGAPPCTPLVAAVGWRAAWDPIAPSQLLPKQPPLPPAVSASQPVRHFGLPSPVLTVSPELSAWSWGCWMLGGAASHLRAWAVPWWPWTGLSGEAGWDKAGGSKALLSWPIR